MQLELGVGLFDLVTLDHLVAILESVGLHVLWRRRLLSGLNFLGYFLIVLRELTLEVARLLLACFILDRVLILQEIGCVLGVGVVQVQSG
jgi:hypothetical protein